jgi:hypothetical protein
MQDQIIERRAKSEFGTTADWARCLSPIAFRLFRVVNLSENELQIKIGNNEKFTRNELQPIEEANSGPYFNSREVTKRVELENGYIYVCIPATFSEDVDLKFFLRLFTRGNKDSEIKITESNVNSTFADKDLDSPEDSQFTNYKSYEEYLDNVKSKLKNQKKRFLNDRENQKANENETNEDKENETNDKEMKQTKKGGIFSRACIVM